MRSHLLTDMNIDELTQNDKNMDFRPINFDRDAIDGIMAEFGISDPIKVVELGVLLLHGYVKAKQDGMNMAYFSRPNAEGKSDFFMFDFLKLVETIKQKPKDDSATYSMKVTSNES